MDDLISRQAVLDMLEDINNHIIDGYGYKHDWCVEWVKGLSSIDAVQVVQCKDCLFNDGDGPNEDGKYWCALHQSFMQYCSEAKKKEE